MRAALFLTAFVVAGNCLFLGPARADEAKKTDAAPQMQPAKPGPEHAFLAKQVGKWKATQKVMMDPTQPPIVSEGMEVCTTICNGLFLLSSYRVKDAAGEFSGSGLIGYDTAKQKYTGVWVDTFGTGMYPYEGTCAGNQCTYTMNMTGPDGKQVTMTMLSEMIDDNHRKFSMKMPGPDGKTMTTMEIEYTRM